LNRNVICHTIQGSHSGMTAEGDNSVLMQKVVKDILSDHRKKIHDNVKFSKEQIAHFKTLSSFTTEDLA